jgi:glycine betaine/proline transport system permease protein
MLYKIPIGEVFEAFINWLKDSFSVVFNAISAVLNFAIEALENVLLLNHAAVYPAVILVLLAGLLVYGAAAGRARRLRVALAAVVALGLGGIEVWRYQQLEYTLDAQRAAEVRADLAALHDALSSAAPPDYALGLAALQPLGASAGLDAAQQRQVARAERRLERLRPDNFDDAAAALDDLLEDADAGELPVDPATLAAMKSAARQYHALSLTEDLERLGDRLQSAGGPVLRREQLTARAWQRFDQRLAALQASDAEWARSDAVTTALSPVKRLLGQFNPERLGAYTWLVMIFLLTVLAWISAGRGLALFSLIGFMLVVSMGFWVPTMESLALVLSATIFALILGIPLGIYAARNRVADGITRPILDFMQTMPAFVYLIPAVLFFGLGKVPGAMATLIFAMPPAVRLTSLGIRQVPTEVVEACLAFGATPRQLLFKAQIPIARPTILAGLNQTIMLALSMVVIGGMIGAGGLGQEVLSGITQLKIGLGFESGISVVILAIFLDRVTQSFGNRSKT